MVARDGVRGELTVTASVHMISYAGDKIVLELALPLLLPTAKKTPCDFIKNLEYEQYGPYKFIGEIEELFGKWCWYNCLSV